MPPIIVRISNVSIAILRATCDFVVVREIAWKSEDRNGDNPEGKNADDYSGHSCANSATIGSEATEGVGHNFSNEEVEERQDREEVAEPNIEVTGSTEIDIQGDEANHSD